MTNHALGILDLHSKHDNSELSHLADASVIPWPSEISKQDREFPSRGLLEGEEPRARFAVDQGNRSNQLAEGLHHS